jgi:hypothetical protein
VNVIIRMLPDGSGRVRIHWFCRALLGVSDKIATRGIVFKESGQLGIGPVQGHIACQPARTGLHSDLRAGQQAPLMHTDDPRAATCPECMATPEFKEAMAANDAVVPPSSKN